jgi:hypothetical protein
MVHDLRSDPGGRTARVVVLLASIAWWTMLPWALAETGCPSLLAPSAGEVIDNGRLDGLDDLEWTFRWSACDGAEAYQLVVLFPGAVPAIDVELAATEFTTTRVAGLDVIEPWFLEDWAWQVRAQTGGDWGPWSEQRAFSVEPPDADPVADFGEPADCPQPLAPVAGAVLDNGRMDMDDEIAWSFAWTPCPGASSYWLLAMRDGAPHPAVSERLVGTSLESVRLGDVVAAPNLSGWSWRVRAQVDGAWQPWSVGSAFSVEPPDSDPARPELVTPVTLEPAAGATLPNADMTWPEEVHWVFRWSHVPIADGYRLVVTAPHLAEPFLDLVREIAPGSWSCDLRRDTCTVYANAGATPVPADAGWSWRVQARLGPVWGPWSAETTFAVAPAREPIGAEARIEGRLEGWTHGPGRIEGFMSPDAPPLGTGQLAEDGSFWISLPPLTLGDVGEVDAANGRCPWPTSSRSM